MEDVDNLLPSNQEMLRMSLYEWTRMVDKLYEFTYVSYLAVTVPT